MPQTFWRPARGSYVLARDTQRAEIRKAEREAKTAAKVRDGYRCRWPEKHDCRGELEGVHIFEDKKMGGDHGLRSSTWNLMALCSWSHRRGPASIHGKQLKVEAETEYGADGPCIFFRRDDRNEWMCVGRETSIGVLERD